MKFKMEYKVENKAPILAKTSKKDFLVLIYSIYWLLSIFILIIVKILNLYKESSLFPSSIGPSVLICSIELISKQLKIFFH